MDTNVSRSLFKLLLRSLPVVPGPELFDLVKDLRRSRTSIDEKISNASRSLQEAATLVDDLERDLINRRDKLAQLREEVDRYSKLAEVEESKAAAIMKQLEVTLSRDRGRERWISLGINIIAGLILFLLGVVLGPKVTGLLNGGAR